MNDIHLLGYLASLLIGLSLGLIGGGGSILTMPVMVYLFGVSPVMATTYSLFIVGSTSLAGAARQYREGMVNVRMALFFAATSAIIVFIIRKWVTPLIPEHIATVNGFEVKESMLTMVLFSLLMLVSAIFMVRKKSVREHQQDEENSVGRKSISKMILFGAGIGMVTGLLGAGGGFLLIPALVLVLNLPMKKAIGTSLLVIALNSLIGFSGNLTDKGIDWHLLISVTVLAIAGILAGNYLNRLIAAERLKKGFGWFVLIMAIYILIKELVVFL